MTRPKVAPTGFTTLLELQDFWTKRSNERIRLRPLNPKPLLHLQGSGKSYCSVHSSSAAYGQGATVQEKCRWEVPRNRTPRVFYNLVTCQEVYIHWQQSYIKSESSVWHCQQVCNAGQSDTHMYTCMPIAPSTTGRPAKEWVKIAMIARKCNWWMGCV